MSMRHGKDIDGGPVLTASGVLADIIKAAQAAR